MNVIIMCEESQSTCIEFRKKGHNAYSSDIQNSSGGHPEWHIIGDCFKLFDGGTFICEDGSLCVIDKWDLLIGHPPCTYITNCGIRWFNVEKYGYKAFDRWIDRFEAVLFFFRMFSEGKKKIGKVALENPVGYINHMLKPNQIIQPYYFGDECSKTTCLWLYGLKPLLHLKKAGLFETNVTHVHKGEMTKSGSEKLFGIHTLSLSNKERSKLRSKSFKGISEAMANQWG